MKKTASTKILLIAAFALTTLFFGGCKKTTAEDPGKTLVGKWTQTGGYSYNSEHPDIWTFSASGNGKTQYWQWQDWDMTIGKYVEGRNTSWSYDDVSKTLVFGWTYYVQTLTNSTLVLIDNDGDNYSFRKN